MKYKNIFSFLTAVFFIYPGLMAQQQSKAKDYLHIPGPITFKGKSYALTWSAHPAAAYYKQEYLPVGDNADTFTTMLLAEVITGNTDIKSIVSRKLEELKGIKASNPVVNYNSFDNPVTGEYMIDFLLSANGPDGSLQVVERNVYRYKKFTDKSGNKGVLLFGVSTRSYGNDIDKFLLSLKETKQDMVNAVAKFPLPEVTVQ